MSFLERNPGAQVFLAELPGRDAAEVEADEVLDALVAVLLWSDETQWTSVAGAEGHTVEVRRKQNVGCQGIAGDEVPAAMIDASGHEIGSGAFVEAERCRDLMERYTRPDERLDRPRRHTVEVSLETPWLEVVEVSRRQHGYGLSVDTDGEM